MRMIHITLSMSRYFFIMLPVLFVLVSTSFAGKTDKNQSPPRDPVRVAAVKSKMISDQVSLVGTAEAVAKSTVAAEVSGVVEYFPVQEGDFVDKGELLVRLRSTDLALRLKGALAMRGKIKANLQYAEKELKRVSKLKETESIAERKYDEALHNYSALLQEMLQSEAEIERLEYELQQKKVFAPFSGFMAKEHTEVGEWIKAGGPVVTLVDLSQIRVTVDVPERYAVMLSHQSSVKVIVKSISNDAFPGRIYAVLPEGDANTRTFPVRINIKNPNRKIKSGMEATVTFNLKNKKQALLVPKDAVVTVGNERLVYLVADGKTVPVNVSILGYYDGDVAIKGTLKSGDQVVIRGNERLRPGQPVLILK